MSGTDGQERRGGRWWRWPATALVLLIEAILIIVVIGGTALAWRAAQGPVDLSFLLPKIGRVIAVAAPELEVSIGHLAVAWKGFTKGPDQPVQVTGASILVDDPPAGRSLAIDRMSLDLSAAWAVRGVIAPRSVTLVRPSVTLQRGAAAQPQGAHGSPGRRPMSARDIIAILERPPETDQHLVKEKPAALSELTRVVITQGELLVEPAAVAPQGKTFRAGNIGAVLTRAAAGGVEGHVSAILSAIAAGQPVPAEPADTAQTPTVSGAVTLDTTGIAHIQAQAKVDDPAGLMAALAPPQGTPVPAMPLQATADVTTSSDFMITALKASLTGARGSLLVGGGTIR